MHTKRQKKIIKAIGIVAILMIVMGLILPYVNLGIPVS
jgi:hypothetical protein